MEIFANFRVQVDSLFFYQINPDNDFRKHVKQSYKTKLVYDSVQVYSVKNPIKTYHNPDYYLSKFDNFYLRDSIMYENFKFLFNYYKSPKTIVLTSNFHVRKSVKPFIDKKIIGNNTISVGERIYKGGFHSYHIAIISSKVEYPNKLKQDLYYNRNRNSIEYYLEKQNFTSSFMELKDVRYKDGKSFIMYPIWKFKTFGNWQEAFDAIIYYPKIKT